MRRGSTILAVVALSTAAALGATPLAAQARDELSLEAFLGRVRATHPQVRQAELNRRIADAEALAARGAFDPSLALMWDTKEFKGIGYFDELDARVTLPTPWGFDVKVGWERAAGQIINPERATPGDGLLSAGLSFPLGPRLVTDERRTALRQAELAQAAADADLDAALARALQGAARAWGLWAEADARARVARDGVELAAFRLRAVRARVTAGDAAAIDSLEAHAELERRELARIDAEAAATAARLTVAAWLWRDDGAPDTLGAATRPGGDAQLSALGVMSVGDAAGVSRLVVRHPMVQQADARWRQADASRRLAAASVLPSASVELSGLAAGRAFGDLALPRADGENTKTSVLLRSPLVGRTPLGRLRAAEDRSRALLIERERVRREVAVEIERAVVELRAVEAQVARQAALLTTQEQLLAAEHQRFDAGESSLLVVNLRERAVLDERLRVAQLVGRRAAALGTLAAALGTPHGGAGGTTARRAP